MDGLRIVIMPQYDRQIATPRDRMTPPAIRGATNWGAA
jgi:hypothetical protein